MINELSSKTVVEYEEVEKLKRDPWKFISDISDKKQYIFDASDIQLEKEYDPFLTNRNFSHFPDTVLFANDINSSYNLHPKLQYDYYFYSIKKRFRRSSWYKQTKDDDIKVIMKKYKYNRKRAEEVLPMLSKEQLNELKQSLFIGGTKKSYNF